MVPTWAYLKKHDAVFVNLFIGSRINVGDVAGTRLEMVQETNYPWQGAVAITVNPEKPREFAVHVRAPDRNTSALYSATPAIKGIERLRVNGKAVAAQIENGYAVIRRRWQTGDRIEFELPLAPQRVVADQKIEATRGKVALRYGPVVYNVEVADQPRIDQALSAAPIAATWRADLLGGVMTLTGKWTDGTPMVAVPNFARMNRTGLAAPEFPRDQFEGGVLSRVWVAAPHTG
jgi:DUF1680 family protein